MSQLTNGARVHVMPRRAASAEMPIVADGKIVLLNPTPKSFRGITLKKGSVLVEITAVKRPNWLLPHPFNGTYTFTSLFI